MNEVNIVDGRLFINGIEVPFEVVSKIVNEEIDKEILKDLRTHGKELLSGNTTGSVSTLGTGRETGGKV